MKKIIVLLLALCLHIYVYSEERYHIKVLNEISYQQAQNYEKKWEISTYTFTNAQGISTTRYFIFANSIEHNSSIVLESSKQSTCPWSVRIDGRFYYAEFTSDEELEVGDRGVLKYDGSRLYFYFWKEE